MTITGYYKFETPPRELKELKHDATVCIDLDVPNAYLKLQETPEGSVTRTSWLSKQGKVMFGYYTKAFKQPFVLPEVEA